MGSALEAIYNCNDSKNLITIDGYNRLRSSAYNYCRSSELCQANATRSISSATFGHGRNSDHPVPDLFLKLDDFLAYFVKNILEDLLNRCDEDLLCEYSKTWTVYKKNSKSVAPIFDELSKSVRMSSSMGYYQLALLVWKREILPRTYRKITIAALIHVNKARDGLNINRKLVNAFVDSLVEVGIHEESDYNVEFGSNEQVVAIFKTLPTTCVHPIYREWFLKPLLHQTHSYYIEWSSKFLKDGEFPKYLEQVQSHFQEEESFCNSDNPCFDVCTLVPLCSICADALVTRNIDRFYTEFVKLLDDQQIVYLLLIYDLCNRVPSSLEKLKELLGKYIGRTGLTTINHVSDKAEKSPKLFVGTIVQLHNNFSNLVKDAFRTNNEFMTAMEIAFIGFVAENNLTNGGKLEAKSSRLVANYYDQLLRKGVPQEERISGLEKAITACKYIRDKDTFNDHYSKLLCKRLIYSLNDGIDPEKAALSKLREKFQCPKAMDSLIHDSEKSSVEMSDFKKMKESLPVKDFSVVLFSEKAWPFPSTSNFSLPPQLNDCVNAFIEYYKKKYNNKRKLNWIFQVSRGEISSVDGTFDKKYDFLCTTQQMTILMIYNKYNSCTVSQLVEELKIPKNQILTLLQVLCKIGMLIKNGSGNFCFNTKFKSENSTIDLIRALTTTNTGTQRKELGGAQKRKKDAFRKAVLESTIVRIMKARRTLKHVDLIAEVMRQINGKFVVQTRMIKTSIEQLIKDDYIKRSMNNNNIYEYNEGEDEG
ncbi:CULLIN_2 domain-containing protein [Meloidogyne graminicola]|uniref:Cullin-5 n=1 Tax=Meloidogyne graminicola TaxID=189291 RepID=A0A8S9ZF13_9BILA|nr:CULLIN_2 domain-containing protein [Meloidogyne graminicola]